MINTKGNQKKEIHLLKLSVKNYLESVDEIYDFYQSRVIKEKIESLKVLISEEPEIIEFNEEQIRESIEKGFNKKESINNSLFIFSISIIENTLKKVAFILNNSLTLKTESGIGRKIVRIDRFIRKKVGLDIDFPEWERLNTYYDIRNCLVHSAGVIKRKKAKKLSSEYNLIFDKYWGIIIIDEKFLKNVCIDVERFFDKYLEETLKRI